MIRATLTSIALLASIAACGMDAARRPDAVEWKDATPSATRRAPLPAQSLPPDIRVEALADESPARKIAARPTQRMGPRIDRALTYFVAKRSGSQPTQTDIPSPALLGLWRHTLESMDESLNLRPGPADLGGLVRGRVTLEVEMDRDRERFKDVPHELTVAYIEVLEKIDRRVRELRAITDGNRYAGAVPDHEGALVLRWPLGYLVPSSPFGYRRDPITSALRFHSGVDLSAGPETTVTAAAPGVVVFAAWSGGYGKYVVIEHAYGVRTHYAHLGHLFVSTGLVLKDRVPIGTVGSTGRSTGPHLHYGVSHAGRYLDPTLFTNTSIMPDGSIPDS